MYALELRMPGENVPDEGQRRTTLPGIYLILEKQVTDTDARASFIVRPFKLVRNDFFFIKKPEKKLKSIFAWLTINIH